MIESDFYSVLTSSDTTGLYGTVNFDDSPVVTVMDLCDSRVYPLVLPTQPTLPAITYSFIGGTSRPTNDSPGSQRYRVEVNCWGNTYSEAVTLRAAVITALNGYPAGRVQTTSIQSIQYLQPTDFFDHDVLQYRAMVEFYVYANFK